jgi:hypothetical protein
MPRPSGNDDARHCRRDRLNDRIDGGYARASCRKVNQARHASMGGERRASRLQQLWWRIAGEPELWLWPHRVEFPFQYDPAKVRRLKDRLEAVHEDETGTRWFRDHETGQVWKCTVAPWEFWDVEIWMPVADFLQT